MKILVVDDSSLIRRTIIKIVVELGHKAVEAENGAEALTVLRKQGADIELIVLDWNMPVMDGFQVLTKIRSDRQFDHILVLMATADGVDEDVRKAITAGANDYLIKPFTKEDISARIAKLLSSRAAKQHQ